jgi:geranylgeranyl diphosphate synthase type II
MNDSARIEAALRASLTYAQCGSPPRIAAALEDAVFPGGARARPRLCLAVAAALGDARPHLADAAAAGVELVHCASLVHDDLPCFDDASTRRGRPSVHAAHGEALAVLAGDALLIAAVETVARAARDAPDGVWLIEVLARGVAPPNGIIAGQAWEAEREVHPRRYRRAKTGALFVAAVSSGALAARGDPGPWQSFAQAIGEAYQVADDLGDVLGDAAALGKPTGRDRALRRPNAAREMGVTEAVRALDQLFDHAMRVIPPCPHPEAVQAWLTDLARGFAQRAVAAPVSHERVAAG